MPLGTQGRETPEVDAGGQWALHLHSPVGPSLLSPHPVKFSRTSHRLHCLPVTLNSDVGPKPDRSYPPLHRNSNFCYAQAQY